MIPGFAVQLPMNNPLHSKKGVKIMETTEMKKESGTFTWLIAVGLMYIAMVIILARPQGSAFDALRGLLTGIGLCCGLVYFVLTYLPEKFR